MHSVLEQLRRPTLPQAELLARIAALNADPAIHGILVQMPLPRHIDAQRGHRGHRAGQGRRRLLACASAGELMTGLPGLRPCTPYGCMKLIESDRRATRAASTRWSSAAATPSASRWRCCCCRPTPR
ncbi:MAG: hypothetical protein MZW92_70410 [Comamonadaceae bacterium]|nr:hypothetical protein [Comamonadaceae bacterium]